MTIITTFMKTFLMSLGVALLLGTSNNLHAEPYIPQKDSVVLEQLPAAHNPHIKKLHELRTQLSRNPDDLTLALRLARAYIHLGRTHADPRYDGYAQAALTPWWNVEEPPQEVLLIRATLLQRGHNFDRALQDLARIIQAQPNNVQAWLTQSVIHQVRGNYRKARQSCVPLLRLANAWLSSTCIANAVNLNGRALESYQVLQRRIEQDASSPPQEKLWSLTILAETATRLGKYSEAEEYFKKSLAVNSEDTYLLGAYSDFLLDQSRPTEVQRLLKNKVLPDGLLLRLALAEQQLNTSTLQHRIEMLKARFTENGLRGETRHLREEARFRLHLLHRPGQALKLAKKNWDIQREPWDARILLEAALQSGDWSAAQRIVNWVTSNNLEDAQLEKLVGQL